MHFDAGIIILSAIANRFRLNKLSRVDQFVMSYGGLRGAVAFALALLIKQQRVESQPMFVTTTIAVIYFTVFLQGITIKPLVKFLNVKRANKKKPTMNERIHERVSHQLRSCGKNVHMKFWMHLRTDALTWNMIFRLQLIDHLMAGMEDIVGKTGNYHVRDKFKRFDNKFIRPLILKHVQVWIHFGNGIDAFFSLLFFSSSLIGCYILQYSPLSRKSLKLIQSWPWKMQWILCNAIHRQLVKCLARNRWAPCFAVTQLVAEGWHHHLWWTHGNF